MREHEVNKLNNFIAGWYANDVSVCDELIDYHLHHANKSPGKIGLGVDITFKKSIDSTLFGGELANCYFSKILNPCVAKYIEKYPYCNEYDPWTIVETINIQQYNPGDGFYKWHTERGGKDTPCSERHLVFITYLNDVTDDGETEFLHQRIKIKPEKGLTIIWPVDWTFTHRGVTSKSQQKFILTGWYSYLPKERR